MTKREAIQWLKEAQSHIDLEAGGYTQEMYDAIELAIKTLKIRTMRLGDLDALKREIDTIKQTAYDGNEEPVYFVELSDLIKVIDNAQTVDDERIVRALETIQTVIDNTNGNTDNVSKAIRNTAKIIRNAIDGEMPDYENVEGEDCGERPTGEWIDMPFGHHCSNCYKGTIFVNREYAFCPNCGAKMKGGAENE